MHRAARLSAILERLADGGSVAVADLADDLDASPATIRRDLVILEQQRLLARTHGGATAHAVSYELPLRYKGVRYAEEKRRIAREAAAQVSEGMAVGLTGGTTATEVARALADQQKLTIVTNALNIASELAVRPGIKLITTGGVARSQSYELSGPIAEASLTGLNLNVAFIGVDGIDPQAGCTTHHEVEAHTNAVMIKCARRVVVVADSSKIGKVAFARICEVSAVSELITDAAADADAIRALTDCGVHVTWWERGEEARRPVGAEPAAAAVGPEREGPRAFDLLVIGDCNPDVLVLGDDLAPAFGQQEKLVDSMSLVVGGSASITAVAAARLGLRVALVAAIGDDAAGHFMLAELARAGVDTDVMAVRAESPTGMTVALSRGDDRAILTAAGAIGTLTPADVPADLLTRARHVHVSSYFLLERSLGPGLAALLATARAAGASTSLDTNWDPAGTWGADFFPERTRADRSAAAQRGGSAADSRNHDAAGGDSVAHRGRRRDRGQARRARSTVRQRTAAVPGDSAADRGGGHDRCRGLFQRWPAGWPAAWSRAAGRAGARLRGGRGIDAGHRRNRQLPRANRRAGPGQGRDCPAGRGPQP